MRAESWPTVAVVNAGNHPELAYAAAALAKKQSLTSYYTASSLAFDSRILSISKKSWVEKEMRRRQLPAELTRKEVRRYGAAFELLRVLGMKMPGSTPTDALLRARNRWFEHRVKEAIKKSPPGVTMAQHTVAVAAFRSATTSLRVLNYPLPHPEWISENLRAEASMNKTWAKYLQHVHEPQKFYVDTRAEMELADVILVASSFSKRTFCEYGYASEKIRVLPLGADLSRLSLLPQRKNFSVSQDTLNIGFIGQITQRKGVSYLLEAIEACRDFGVPTLLHIVGTPYNGIERRLAGIPNVKLHGPRNHGELAAVYQSMDLVALPSLADGFGLVLAESLACGTPVLATDRTLGGDFVEHGVNGYLCAAGSSEEILQALRDAYQRLEEVRSSMRLAAVKSAEKLDWRRYQEGILDVVGSLMPG